MATQVALAGIANLYIDGNLVKLVSSLAYQTSNMELEGQNGMDGFHGFTGKYVMPYISFKVRITKTNPLSDYDNLTSVTVVAELINGSTVSGYAMFLPKPPEGNAEDGTADLRFEGGSVSVD